MPRRLKNVTFSNLLACEGVIRIECMPCKRTTWLYPDIFVERYGSAKTVLGNRYLCSGCGQQTGRVRMYAALKV